MRQETHNVFNGGLNYDLNPITTPNDVLTDSVNGTFITFNGDELALQNDAGNTTIDPYWDPTLYPDWADGDEYRKRAVVRITAPDGKKSYYKSLIDNNTEDYTNPLYWELIPSVVRLSDGFYPLALKEYGGVLYIISGKEPIIVAELYNPIKFYNKGEVVYKVYNTGLGDVRYYFESLIDSNDGGLSYEGNDKWFSVGIHKDFINRYGFVEFGSYPSPEIIDSLKFNTDLLYEVENTISTPPEEFVFELYNPKTINNSTFRAGVYVTFGIDGLKVFDDISYQIFQYSPISNSMERIEGGKQIYKVRLLHQLTNGFIDLTDDIWLKYAEFLNKTIGTGLNMSVGPDSPSYWFSDPTFKYYCPHNFKGKLVMVVELEELDIFELTSTKLEYYKPEFGTDFFFYITLGINYKNTAKWSVHTDFGYYFNSVGIYKTKDGSEPDIYNPATDFQSIETNDNEISLFQYPHTDTGLRIRYKIIPEFCLNGTKLALTDLPKEFIDEHTLEGSVLLNSDSANLGISIDTVYDICDPGGSGIKTSRRLTLINSLGDLLSNDLLPSFDKYQFYLAGTQPASGTLPDYDLFLGTYTIVNGRAICNPLTDLNGDVPILPDAINTIVDLLATTMVEVPSSDCLFVPLTVTVNLDYKGIVPISVRQGSNIISPIIIDNKTFKYNVQSGINFTILPFVQGVIQDVSHYYTANIIIPSSVNFGLVTQLLIHETNAPGNIRDSYIKVNMNENVFGSVIPNNRFDVEQINLDLDNNTIPSVIKWGWSNSTKIYNYFFDILNPPIYAGVAVFRIDFVGTPIASNTYANLGSIPVVAENNHLFLKQYANIHL